MCASSKFALICSFSVCLYPQVTRFQCWPRRVSLIRPCRCPSCPSAANAPSAVTREPSALTLCSTLPARSSSAVPPRVTQLFSWRTGSWSLVLLTSDLPRRGKASSGLFHWDRISLTCGQRSCTPASGYGRPEWSPVKETGHCVETRRPGFGPWIWPGP